MPVNWDIIKRVFFCMRHIKSKYYMVCYGDTFADINLDNLIKKFQKN